VYPQRVRHVKQVAEFHLCPALHALDRRPVEPSYVGKGLLGQVQMQAPHTDAVADGPAGLKDPLGLIGWHSINALSIMIISQQQI
jgi:hypothetical protein